MLLRLIEPWIEPKIGFNPEIVRRETVGRGDVEGYAVVDSGLQVSLVELPRLLQPISTSIDQEAVELTRIK